MPNLGQTVVNIPGQLPKSALARGGLTDAMYLEHAWNNLAAGATDAFDCNAMAFYVDQGSATLSDMAFTLDDCFPFCQFKVGFFFRLRPFTRLILKNTSGAPQSGHLVYSANPEFLVMQFAP